MPRGGRLRQTPRPAINRGHPAGLLLAHPPLPPSLLPFAALLKGATEDFLLLDAPLWLSRAPGSVDVLGGPAEMPGMLSVSQALGRSVFCAIQNRKDDRIRIRVLRGASEGGPQEWTGRIGTLYTKKGPPRSLVVLQQQFEADKAPWMMEFVAAMIGLRRTHQLNTPKQGFDLVLWDQVPTSSGAGRTAARATALALAFKAATGLDKKRVDGVRVARAVSYGQHEVLARTLGLTPALTSGIARTGCLLQTEHAPDPIMQWVPLPDHVQIAVVDLGLGAVSAPEAVEAASVAAHMALERLNAGLVKAKKPPRAGWGQVTASEFEGGLRNFVPVKETGAEWSAAFSGMQQTWAEQVVPASAYRLRAVAEHHVREAGRARRFLDSLQEYARARREEDLIEVGRSMTGSHRSLAEKCGIASAPVDDFIARLNEGGRKAGFFGARLAEAGGGSLVSVLAQSSALERLREIVKDYSKAKKTAAALLPGSGQGGVLMAWWEGVLETVDEADVDEVPAHPAAPKVRETPVAAPDDDEST